MIYYVLFIHWIADFVFQTDYMAKNKSKNIEVLLAHIMEYLAVIGIGFLWLGVNGVRLAVINSVAHFIIDFFTSKITNNLFSVGKTHYGFVVIGFDQFLHVAFLIYTFNWLFKK